jgi:hypothetical protein
MRQPKFPNILALVAKGAKTQTRFQWELGDTLVQEIGPPQRDGATGARFEALSEELKQHGHEYEVTSLRALRNIAYAYPDNRRYPALSFGVHQDAGDPDVLDAIVEGAPKGQLIVQAYVRMIMQAMALERQRKLDAETDRRRDAADKARREREEAEAAARTAKTASERKAAADRATAAAQRERQNKVPPKRGEIPKGKPKAADLPILLARAAFARDLARAKKIVGALRETYAEFIPAFGDVDIENGHEELMAIAEMARAFADLLHKRGNGGKSSHLSVVGDGG